MKSPDEVADAAKAKLVTNKVALGIKDAQVLAEDTDAKELRPPYCGVYIDFENESVQETGDSVQLDVPVELKILCSSSENKSSKLSFAEAYAIAGAVVTLMKGVLTVEDEEVVLSLRKRPFTIIRSSAEQCVIQVNFYFELAAIGG